MKDKSTLRGILSMANKGFDAGGLFLIYCSPFRSDSHFGHYTYQSSLLFRNSLRFGAERIDFGEFVRDGDILSACARPSQDG